MKLWKIRRKEMDAAEKEFEDVAAPEITEKKRKGIGKARERIGKLARRAGRFAKKHKLLTAVLILLFIGLAVFAVHKLRQRRTPQMEMDTVIETTAIEKMDLSNSISVTGTIATASSKTGTTSLSNLKVTAVYVEVGDEVQEGDIICTFDSSDIEEALATAKNNYSVNQQLDALEDYTTTYTETLEDAEETLQDARDTRDAYKSAYKEAVSAEETALAALNSVKSKYDTAALKEAYEDAVDELKDQLGNYYEITVTDLDAFLDSIGGEVPKDNDDTTCTTAHNAYQTAKSKYEEAQSAVSQAQSAYEQAQKNTSSAYAAYENAQEAREKAQDVYEDTVEQAEEAYNKARLNDQLISDNDEQSQIEEYEEQLSDCTVYAAMSGTITTLNVEEGESFAGGSIYEIQDMSYFIVEASVDEYDIVDIAKGMKAYVKTDATGDEELEAEVTFVAPTGTSGMTMGSASGTASYEIEITITDPQTRLRSGMAAQVSIALEESRDALAVPYDCVQTNASGESVIYIDDNGERKEVVVETGIETSYYTEVISDELSEGMTVYLSTVMVQSSGTLSDDSDDSSETMFNVGGGMDGGMGGSGNGGGGGMPSGGGGGGMGGGPGGF